MSTVEEDIKSRTGLQLGANGAYQATRTFRVYLDSAGLNPIRVMQTSSAVGGVSIGTQFPWVDVPLYLLFFAIRDCLTPKLYIVDAVYGPPFLAFPTVPGWTFRSQVGLDTEFMLYDLDGNGIGPADYSATDAATGNFLAQTRSGTTHLVVTENATITDPRQARRRNIIGTDRFIPGGTALFQRTVPQFDTNTIGFANAHAGLINSDALNVLTTAQPSPVYFGPAGTFMLAGVSADPESNAVYGDGQGGRYPAYRVTIELRHRRDGWQHRLTHTFKTDDGAESPVTYSDGTTVDEEFRLYDAINFTGLFQSFGG